MKVGKVRVSGLNHSDYKEHTPVFLIYVSILVVNIIWRIVVLLNPAEETLHTHGGLDKLL